MTSSQTNKQRLASYLLVVPDQLDDTTTPLYKQAHAKTPIYRKPLYSPRNQFSFRLWALKSEINVFPIMSIKIGIFSASQNSVSPKGGSVRTSNMGLKNFSSSLMGGEQLIKVFYN